MLKFVALFCVAIVVLAQRRPGNFFDFFGQGLAVDSVHQFRVQYDDQHDLIVFVSRSDCYLIDVSATGSEAQWDHLIHTSSDLHAFTETVYQQIESKSGVTDITERAAVDYHSRLEQWECHNKHIHEVAITLPTPAN